MPVTYENNEINERKWYQEYAQYNDIPTDQARAYKFLFNEGVKYFKVLIDDIIENNGGVITLPLQVSYIEKYLTGFCFEYRVIEGFDVQSEVEGYWRKNAFDPTRIIIFYKQHGYRQRERYTQVHELMHFIQTLDPMFLNTFDDLIWNSALPPKTIIKLLERLTDRATAMFLMPNDFFQNKYREIQNESQTFGYTEIRELARAFDVSMQSATYRINECLTGQETAI